MGGAEGVLGSSGGGGLGLRGGAGWTAREAAGVCWTVGLRGGAGWICPPTLTVATSGGGAEDLSLDLVRGRGGSCSAFVGVIRSRGVKLSSEE